MPKKGEFEKCTCGHSISKHWVLEFDIHNIPISYGGCKCKNCECKCFQIKGSNFEREET